MGVRTGCSKHHHQGTWTQNVGHMAKNRVDQERTRLKNAISSSRRLAECGCDSGHGAGGRDQFGGGGKEFPSRPLVTIRASISEVNKTSTIYQSHWTHPFVGDVVHQSSRSVHRSHAYYASRAMRAKEVEGKWVAQEKVRRRWLSSRRCWGCCELLSLPCFLRSSCLWSQKGYAYSRTSTYTTNRLFCEMTTDDVYQKSPTNPISRISHKQKTCVYKPLSTISHTDYYYCGLLALYEYVGCSSLCAGSQFEGFLCARWLLSGLQRFRTLVPLLESSPDSLVLSSSNSSTTSTGR